MQSSEPGPPNVPRFVPTLGCLAILAALSLTCLMPVLLVDAMRFALMQLNLTPGMALAVVLGMFLGGVINLPIYEIQRDEPQTAETYTPFGWPNPRRFQTQSGHRFTVIAVNLGGCVIPVGLAVWEVTRIARLGGSPLLAMLFVSAVNIIVCYRAARPIHGLGITLPGFIAPAVAIAGTCILLYSDEFAVVRAPVAFVAGIVGPLIGADLLHLKDISHVNTGMLSIGGAGTFDGIVLSGVAAAFVCGLLGP